MSHLFNFFDNVDIINLFMARNIIDTLGNIIFNTAYEDESTLKIITDRKKIAAFYLKGWFLVDLLSILPFDLSEVNGINKMMRFGRLSKLYKLIKLGRLTRMVKLAKQKNKFIKYL